jgi:ATP-dependent DNA helicase PIF1
MIQCCAATTLAALLFEGAQTAHSLFKYPVTEEADYDPERIPECKLNEKCQRLELLLETVVIFWDEFPSNDREIFEAVIRKLQQWSKRKFIFVCAGDFHQILPIVPGGSKQEIIDACILASPYWPQFKKRYLYENMRVNGLLNSLTDDSTEEEIKHVEEQKLYADFLVDLSKNRSSKSLNIIDSKLIHLE